MGRRKKPKRGDGGKEPFWTRAALLFRKRSTQPAGKASAGPATAPDRGGVKVLALACACAGAAWSLFRISPPVPPPAALEPARLESDVRALLLGEGIPLDSISTRTHALPELGFRRAEWRIGVPWDHSSTTLHYRIDEQLRPLGYSTPAKVTFPSKTMTIHLVHSGTVWMSLVVTPYRPPSPLPESASLRGGE